MRDLISIIESPSLRLKYDQHALFSYLHMLVGNFYYPSIYSQYIGLFFNNHRCLQGLISLYEETL